MPKRIAERNPLETFGPEIKQALLQGSQQRFILPFPSRTKAKSFQRRCNGLRAALRRNNHEDYKAAARCRVSVWWKAKDIVEREGFKEIANEAGVEAEAYVVCSPHDAEFRDILATAGIKFDPDDLHQDSPLTPEGDGDSFLDSLQKEKLP